MGFMVSVFHLGENARRPQDLNDLPAVLRKSERGGTAKTGAPRTAGRAKQTQTTPSLPPAVLHVSLRRLRCRERLFVESTGG